MKRIGEGERKMIEEEEKKTIGKQEQEEIMNHLHFDEVEV
jgi:hypothetical protein